MERHQQTKRVAISGRRKTDMAQASLNQHFGDEIEVLKKNDDEMQKQVGDNHAEIMALLGPISETYKIVSRLGKWAMPVVLFISIVVGIIAGLMRIFHK